MILEALGSRRARSAPRVGGDSRPRPPAAGPPAGLLHGRRRSPLRRLRHPHGPRPRHRPAQPAGRRGHLGGVPVPAAAPDRPSAPTIGDGVRPELKAAWGRRRRGRAARGAGNCTNDHHAPATTRRPAPTPTECYAARPSAAIRLVCASVIRENIFPTSARSKPSATPPTSIVDSASRSATTRWGLRQRLAHQPPRPQRQPAAHARVGVDGGPHLLHREIGVPGVVEHGQHQLAGVGGRAGPRPRGRSRSRSSRRRTPDQALQPVRRRGLLCGSRRARPRTGPSPPWLLADLGQPVPQPFEVVELGRGHLRQLRLVREGRRQLGVLREPLERRQLPVRQRAEQVHDRGAVPRVGGRLRPVLGGDTGGFGGFGGRVLRLVRASHEAHNSPLGASLKSPADHCDHDYVTKSAIACARIRGYGGNAPARVRRRCSTCPDRPHA